MFTTIATEPNDVRRTTLRRLSQELIADVKPANNLLHELNRYLEQLRTRAPKLLRVEALRDDPLINLFVVFNFKSLFGYFVQQKMSRDVPTVGSTMRIPLLYRGEYSQWVERFMNYLEEQTDGEAMINSIKNGDQPLPRVTQVSIAGTSSNEQPSLKDKSMWSDQEKKIQKIDRLASSLLIQGLP
nr:hypothetical protein [Tanacetum cinerariifolium]